MKPEAAKIPQCTGGDSRSSGKSNQVSNLPTFVFYKFIDTDVELNFSHY